ncbi:hypothetical protein GCM10023208_08180 [Erythrobacter westpacificensis]|uniref:Uncharacterized protein n=1 Tax=Erythrobacter westpacificensis TaxID=1055231 RepID=A0ABP9K4X9_9SPHN
MDTLPKDETATNPDEFDILFAALKHAKAKWDMALYAPDNVGNDLPQEVSDQLCQANCDALNAFLLHPAKDSRELLIKLRVFRDEEIVQGWWLAPQIVEQLVCDAQTAAFPGVRA